MRTLNFRARKFAIGKTVVVKNSYTIGKINLRVGDIGKIVSESFTNLPEYSLFDVRIIVFNFSQGKISMSEAIAETYMEEL